MDAELARIMRAHRVLSACNHSLVRAADEERFLRDICQIIVDLGGYRMAWVGYVEGAEDQSADRHIVRPVAQKGDEEGYLASTEIRWDESEHGRGPTGTAIRSRVPAVVRNILTNDGFIPWPWETPAARARTHDEFPIAFSYCPSSASLVEFPV